MNVRAITAFIDPGWPVDPEQVEAAGTAMQAIRSALEGAGYPVQTTRLATPPPSEGSRPIPPKERAGFAQRLEAEAFVHGFDYAAVGPALPEEPKAFEVIPDILEATENIFTSALIADADTGLSLAAAASAAEIIVRNSTISPDGFANLRFAALANVPAGGPFFPASYHQGGSPAFALATESAEVAVDALRDIPSLATGRRRLVSMIEAHATAMARTVEPVALEREIRFLGIDFSMAPFPDHLRSIGTALESLGLSFFGRYGSVAAAGFLTDCLDRAQFKRTGFCGLFLPVLEDEVLAKRAADGDLDLTDLLLFSTMCGTGLDTIPLPGDTPAEALTPLLLDLSALALRHNKPLTARLMPLPDKQVGDEVHFDFPYFADSAVMALDEHGVTGLLGGAGILDIGPRRGDRS
jgi:uncharacterized protein (UPF0210 family)